MKPLLINMFAREAASFFWFPVYSFINRLKQEEPGAFRILAFHHLPTYLRKNLGHDTVDNC